MNGGRFSRENIDAAIQKIESLSSEELLFLAIWYYYGISFNAGDEYIEIYKQFHDTYKIPPKIDFDDLFSKFYTNGILDADGGSEYLSELYMMAFEKCIQDNDKINDFFCELILSKKDVDRGYQHDKFCPGIITQNFNSLSKEVQESLIKAANDKDVNIRCGVARSIIWDYNSLPAGIQDVILTKLIHDKHLKEAILDTTNHRFNILPKEFRERIIIELRYPLKIIAAHFNELPPDFQNQFKERIQASIRKDFIRRGDASLRSNAIYAIVGAFENLPEDVQEILWSFIDDSSANVRSDLGGMLRTNFNKLPDDMREQILRKFSVDRNYEVRRSVVPAIIEHFNEIPDDLKDNLEKLAVDDNIWVRSSVAHSLNCLDYINNMPLGCRDRLLKKLVLDDYLFVRDNATSSIVRNFGILQKETRDLFFDLAETGDLEVRKSIAYAVAYYYQIEDTRDLIDKLLPELEEKIRDIMKVGVLDSKDQIIAMIDNTKDKIRKEFAIEILEEISRDDNAEYLRRRTIEILSEFK